MPSKLDQQVVIPTEELARVTAELEAIRDLLWSIRKALIRMTTPDVMEAIAQLDRPV